MARCPERRLGAEPALQDRRQFLWMASCLGVGLWAGASLPLNALPSSLQKNSRIGEDPILDRGYAAVRKIGQGVFATISDVSKGRETLSNGGILVGKDGALLIEGHRTPLGARVEFDALRMVSKVPVLAAIDTHYHYDHSMGNAFYGGLGIPIWAHENTAPLMVQRFAEWQGKDKSLVLGPLEEQLQQAATETDRQRLRGDIAAHQRIFDTIDAYAVALPTRRFSPGELPLSVDLGGLKVLIETFPGHSSSDLVICVPEQEIAFTGDLLFNGWYPVCSDADMSGWLQTLDKLYDLGAGTLFVPGHGQLCDRAAVATLRNVILHLREHALNAYRKGLPLDQAQRSYRVPPQFGSFPIVSWAFCMDAAIADFYEGLAAQRERS